LAAQGVGMKKKFFLFLGVAGLILNLSSIITLSQAKDVFELVNVEGNVNKTEIGGDALKVISLWDSRGNILVSEDGSFSTVVSNQRPQKISLVDNKNNTRALAIVLPQANDIVVFDARSTALALLFQDANSFGQSSQVLSFMTLAQNSSVFQELVAYLKINLKNKSLDELNRDEQYAQLLDACNSQIRGVKQDEIKKSLNTAKEQLQRVLP